MNRVRRFLATIALAGTLVSSARADESSPLAALEDAAAALDFVALLDAAESARALGGLGPSELVRLHQLVAMARSFEGIRAGARSSYETMLALDPSARPDASVPPRLYGPFEEALRHVDAVRVDAEATVSANALDVRVRDGIGAITDVRLVYREGDDEPVEIVHASAPHVRFVVPVEPGHTVEYHVSLRDRFGNRWFELGTAQAPRRMTITAPPAVEATPRRRLVRSPWLWAAVGSSAAALALGLGFGLGRDREVRAVTSVSF